jgi:hypothetical protein
MTSKTDFKTEIDAYRARRGRFQLVDVPDLQYLMIDGHGDPNTSPAFTDAVEALYPLAYRLKFASKRILGRDYVVMPLEGLWSADDMDSFTGSRDKSRWDWTLRRDAVSRHCMSVPTTTRPKRWRECTMSSSRTTGSGWSAGITRYTSATPARSRPTSSAPSSDNQSMRQSLPINMAERGCRQVSLTGIRVCRDARRHAQLGSEVRGRSACADFLVA